MASVCDFRELHAAVRAEPTRMATPIGGHCVVGHIDQIKCCKHTIRIPLFDSTWGGQVRLRDYCLIQRIWQVHRPGLIEQPRAAGIENVTHFEVGSIRHRKDTAPTWLEPGAEATRLRDHLALLAHAVSQRSSGAGLDKSHTVVHRPVKCAPMAESISVGCSSPLPMWLDHPGQGCSFMGLPTSTNHSQAPRKLPRTERANLATAAGGCGEVREGVQSSEGDFRQARRQRVARPAGHPLC
jgi:hypothetical protein